MYILVINGVPEKFSYGRLKQQYPSVSFPYPLPASGIPAYGVFPLVETQKPVYDEATENLSEGTPVEGPPGTWTQVWDVSPKTTEEQAEYAKQVERRNNRETVKTDPVVQEAAGRTPDKVDQDIGPINSVPALRNEVQRLAKLVAVLSQQSGLVD